MLNQGSIVL